MDPQTAFTVNGSKVVQEEFGIFLQNQKALTTSYFQTNYHAEYSNEFWTTSFNGEIPIVYAKQKAVDELKRLKVEQQLMKENGEMSAASFDEFMQDLEQENALRRNKIANKETVYGLTQFSPYQYYNYVQSTHYTNLINSLASSKKYRFSDTVYKDYYEKQKENYYNKGYIYEGDIVQNGISAEKIRLDLQAISKEDDLKRGLYATASKMQLDELSDPFPYQNGQARFKLTAKQALGYKSFEDVRSDVIKLYIHEDLQRQIADRLSNAVININGPVYDAVQMK